MLVLRKNVFLFLSLTCLKLSQSKINERQKLIFNKFRTKTFVALSKFKQRNITNY